MKRCVHCGEKIKRMDFFDWFLMFPKCKKCKEVLLYLEVNIMHNKRENWRKKRNEVLKEIQELENIRKNLEGKKE